MESNASMLEFFRDFVPILGRKTNFETLYLVAMEANAGMPKAPTNVIQHSAVPAKSQQRTTVGPGAGTPLPNVEPLV